MAFAWLQTPPRLDAGLVERWLEAERDQIALWLPVLLGTGIALWFILPDANGWRAVMTCGVGISLAGITLRAERRTGRTLIFGGLALALGCGLIWWRAERVASPVLNRPMISQFGATVRHVDVLAAKSQVRFLLVPDGNAGLPPLIRVTVDDENMPTVVAVGAHISLRARLVPPPGQAVPGGYDFTRAAWFQGLGAVGSGMGPVSVSAKTAEPQSDLRARLTAHIRTELPGSEGGIAAAFATGDRGGISKADEDAMRASGLTHLLSVSGLHITAVVAAAMFLTLRLLAFSPWLALRWPLPLIAAGAGALTGIGYTLLTGAEVPTIRSCIAALLVLIGIAIGREAMTLRLVATGALCVLLIWPEALIGASFQLSFAAITTIVGLHDNQALKAFLMRRDESFLRRLMRGVLGLAVTGVAVEIALAPIALFHFHQQGLFGAVANLIAIPLTTFVVMPLEALSLAADSLGVGAPFWWLTGKSLTFLLWLARQVAAMPGAIAIIPDVPVPAFTMMLSGMLWLLLWKTRVRFLGVLPIFAGAVLALSLPPPDLLVTSDGIHMAVRDDRGQMALLRPRTGDFMRDVLGKRSGTLEPIMDLDEAVGASCGRDMCRVAVTRNGRVWRIAATRSDYLLPWGPFMSACRDADILISNRRLPKSCTPAWIKADRDMLASTGGLAITLGPTPRIEMTRQSHDEHPWALIQRHNSAITARRKSQKSHTNGFLMNKPARVSEPQ